MLGKVLVTLLDNSIIVVLSFNGNCHHVVTNKILTVTEVVGTK